MSYFDFSTQIRTLKNANNFGEALTFFKENKSKHPFEKIKSDNYIMANILTCLRKTNNCSAAYKFLDAYDVKINEASSPMLLPAYAWVLYDNYKAENNLQTDIDHIEITEDFFETNNENTDPTIAPLPISDVNTRILEVLPLLQAIDNDFARSPLNRIFQLVCKTEKGKPSVNWNYINQLCNQLDPAFLDTSCESIKVQRNGREKIMELASTHENWYASKTKAIFKLGLFEECFETSKEALENIDSFHYSNDVWFARRIALSKKNMGQSEEALQELQQLLKKKKEWFLYKEVAELHFNLNNNKDALYNACEGMISFGEMTYKTGLIFLIGNILEKDQDNELANKHFLYFKALKQEEDQALPQNLLNKLMDRQLMDKSAISNDLAPELRAFWKKNSLQATAEANAAQGHIKNILNQNDKGVNGFIVAGTKDYYFSLSSKNKWAKLVKQNASVRFIIENQEDGKTRARIIKIN